MRVRLPPQEMREISALLELPQIAHDRLEPLSAPELAELLLHLQPQGLAALESIVGTERLAHAMAHVDPTEAARLLVRSASRSQRMSSKE